MATPQQEDFLMLTLGHEIRRAGCGLLAALLLALAALPAPDIARAAEGGDTVADATTPRPTIALEKCTDRATPSPARLPSVCGCSRRDGTRSRPI